MKKSEELFYLIQSLSKSEKRYFKLSSQGSDEAEYLLLFNAIEAQKTYDEAAIKTQFQDKAFINQLTTIKNYLKHRILQALRCYHAKISVQAELIDIIRNIEILFHKGLYTICNSELKRAEKKATHYQQDVLLFQIKDWKRKVHQATHPHDTATISHIIEAQQEALTVTQEYTNLLLVNTDPTNFSTSTKKTHQLHNSTLQTLHQFKKLLAGNRTEKARQAIESLVKEWEQHPELLKEYFARYFSVCNHHLEYLMHQKMHKEAFVRILLLKQKIETINTTSVALIKEILKLYATEIQIHQKLSDLHNSKPTIANIQAFVERHQQLIPQERWLAFRFQFALLHYQKNEDLQAHYWSQHIIDRYTKKDDPTHITNTYWLHLLIAYRRQDKPAIRTYSSDAKKHIKKSKNIESYERILFRFLSKTIDLPNDQKKAAFRQLQEDLATHTIPPTVAIHIPFEQWITGNL